ncbi:AI-2E family transporter [Clostridium sp. BJN0001]|uniref:AI-2E family transporter n=1 Tax=Clostridium sp. BJN0001 TaxID=2930219 RepID=UPI001FD5A3CE|nr:AI-2E family transporter [Clostridium sp. BJN0001]
MKKQDVKRLIFIGILISIILFIIIYMFSESVKSIINLLIYSFIFAYILKPFASFFENKFNMSHRKASFFVIILIINIIIISVFIIIPVVISEMSAAGDMQIKAQGYIEDFTSRFKLKSTPVISDLYNMISEKEEYIAENLPRKTALFIVEFSQNIISYFVSPIIIYYILADGKQIIDKMIFLIPPKIRQISKDILFDIDKVMTRYISSQLILSFVVFMLTLILLWILNIKFVIVLAILNGIVNIIPYFGAFIGAVPAVLIAFSISPSKAVYTLLGMFLIQQVEGNLLAPMVTSDSTQIHPAIIIISLLLGDTFGGFLGMIIIIPVIVCIKVIYDDINYYLF